LDPDLVESVAGAISEEKIPVVVVRDENVHPSVAIVVGNRHTHPFADVLRNAHRIGHIGKGAVAVVVVEDVWFSLVKRRRTGDALAGRAANPGGRKGPIE